MIEQLLGRISTAAFLEEYFLKRPFSLPHGAAEFTHLADWPAMERILSRPDADVRVAKDGQRVAVSESPTPAEYRRLSAEGCTLLVRHSEDHEPALAELADGFRRDFHAAVDVHVYCTPASRHGFGWHYDAEDVFLLQTVGCKEYSLRKNTVNPWPLEETLPRDMRYEREIMPLMKCRLEAGDWLYIPHGYWHVGQSLTDSITLSVGLMMPTAIDLFDFLRGQLLDSPLWRQRLPVAGAAASQDAARWEATIRQRIEELSHDFVRQFGSEVFLRSWLSRHEMESD